MIVHALEILKLTGMAYGWKVEHGTPSNDNGLTFTRNRLTVFAGCDRRGAITEGLCCEYYDPCGPYIVRMKVQSDDKNKPNILKEFLEKEGEPR